MGPERPPIVFYAFDLLQLNGKNLQNLPIEERKAKLEELLKKPPGAQPIHRAEMSGNSDHPEFCHHNPGAAVDAEEPAPRGFPCIRPRPAQATHLGHYTPEASSERTLNSR